MRRLQLLAGAVAVLLVLAGCVPSPAGRAGEDGAERRTLTVFAAASLEPTFTRLGGAFEATHPDMSIRFAFGGSQELATQLVHGASADVFASADSERMAVVSAAGLTSGEPAVLATNRLAIAVPPDNPAGVTDFDDLAADDVALVVCAPDVPCGAATRKLEQLTGITLRPVSEEQAVTGVLAKVRTGEANAGLVYRTDVIAAGSAVQGIEFAEAGQAVNHNEIVLLKGAPEAGLGQEWIELVRGVEGQAVFADAGFGVAE